MIDGDRLIRLGCVKTSRDHLAAFAAKLTSEDHLVIAATGNAHAVVEAVGQPEAVIPGFLSFQRSVK